MGFLDFLKAKKGGEKAEHLGTAQDFQQLPPLPNDSEMYSELPNLPEAPETAGLPEIELPPPLKGLEGFDFPEGMGEEAGKRPSQRFAEITSPGSRYKTAVAEQIGQRPIAHSSHRGIEPLIPEWPRAAEAKLPELPAMPEQPEEKPWENIPVDVPELRMPEPEHQPGFGGGFVSHKNGFFLKAEDFMRVKGNIDAMVRVQKKHHKLTYIKKEENSHYEQMSGIIEDAQRKLMHVDRTLFE